MALHVFLKFQCFVFLICLQLVSAEVSKNASRPIAKPGCVDKCGDVSIPYPFGIGDGCFANEYFKIRCNKSILIDHFKPAYGGYNVSSISISGGYMTTDVYVATNCPKKRVREKDSGYSLATLRKGFAFSATKNKLTTIGCNTYSYLGLNIDTPSAGCMSMCNAWKDATNGSCTGIGCCQASVPAELFGYVITVGSLGEIRNNTSFDDKCSYAFIVEKDSFNFSSSYLNDFENGGTGMVPAVIDWTIGSESCKEAKKNPMSYACGPNTDCIPGNSSPGYRCGCKTGYEGNPYLNSSSGGECQDINECQVSNKCGQATCINTEGNYMCACSPGTRSIWTTQGKLELGCVPYRRFPIVGVVSAAGVSIVVILMLGMGYLLYIRLEKRKQMKLKEKNFTRNGGLLLKQKITSNEGGVERAGKIFVSEELERTTDNFNPSRIVGKGGYGTVFKGMLSNGEIVAIKKSTLVDENQVDQFINEVAILSQINHRHIVRLLGCCLETHVPLLVYEFVPNGTLSYHLHVREGDHQSLLSWKDRVRIASEVAGALAYLHSDAFMPIFHRDIKSTNILLDEKYKAKVSDFGISRSAPVDSTHLTTLVQGTFGYLDPEYFHSGQFTDKSDVYSFGIVLVELLTGEEALSQIRHGEEKSLALHFVKSVKENRLSEILDARVLNEGDPDDVLNVGKVAEKCLKYVGKKRPTMKEVSLSLGGLHEKLSKDLV